MVPLTTRPTLLQTSFDHQPRTRIVFGNDSVDRLGELARQLEAQRVLLVTDAGLVAAGHVERAVASLNGAGLTTAVYDRVRENPTTDDVDSCLLVARAADIDLLIGFGGGSSLDTAKGCNFLLTNGGQMADYWGVGKATKPMLPLIAVPTTAGTGSECQSFALIADAETHQKMACGDPKAAAAIAVLDPTLTLTQPRYVTACTGIDALAHALETLVTNRRDALSMMYSREAFRMLIANLRSVLEQPEELEARGGMLLGAALAGSAIECSMLGAVHAAANPLTAHYQVAHGQAVAIMLPHVIRLNAQDMQPRSAYAELAREANLCRSDDDHAAVQSLIESIESLVEAGPLHRTLAACAVPREAIDMLAEEATKQWTARFNPTPLTASDFAALYQAASTHISQADDQNY